jgi:hypothetical protein|tara:strand:+ start:323 stop:652 length:330 start_codon:yes stop_codon:yes gene_type:complete
MKKIVDFLKKYKFHIVVGLMVIFFFRSCQKSGDIRKLNKSKIACVSENDSLSNVVKVKTHKIDSFPEFLREEKLNIHMGYDYIISKQNRGEQLMELHMVVKDNIKKLQK